MTTVNRRTILSAGLGMGLVSGASPGAAIGAGRANQRIENLDLSTPGGTLTNYVKLLGTLAQSVVYVSFGGTLWGIAPNKTPVELCGFKGLARMQWTPQDDGSFHRRNFDVGYFSDLETGAPLDTIDNPLTGHSVTPFHYKYGGGENFFAADGVRRISAAGEMGDAKPYDLNWQSSGNQIWITETGDGEVSSPLPAEEWPRESPGDMYRYAGETSFVSTVEQLADPDIDQADYALFWSSILSWEPWLEMDGAPGFVMWRGVGSKLHRYSDADPQLLEYVRAEQPNYFDDDDPWKGTISNMDRFKRLREPATSS